MLVAGSGDEGGFNVVGWTSAGWKMTLGPWWKPRGWRRGGAVIG